MTGLLDKLALLALTIFFAAVATAPRAEELLLGGSRLGIKTEKTLRASDPIRRSECPTDDDDCADNSGLPKSEPGKRSLKTLRRPFIGLSITRPLQ